ncbi:flagellar biosynthetic protein FliO [Halomonas urumqiensis]|uniref:Flagellar protein n=1 Tax=Halomonas urumqiensis TaxID=1684789 RepID=A0A2N7UNT4_9GAMM|nr:flagellar biosynthetic protein FliO [Halomonas urumqiensis]PMR82079.1 flagellar biosynthetic protein FliO [Halomonas urumqiensis]PTB02589.1 flagellar biosynthetic protein FliO [Halomonas urumqiensis]GHE21070.1 hypothetical protein GCM10017767_15910 [Halomonas urumqiensis]
MSDIPTPDASSGGLDGLAAGGELIGLATFGKTAAVLALIVAILLIARVVLKRAGLGQARHGDRLRVVGAVGVGNRERVVIVQVEQTWLVLGVGSGNVNKLHELPAPPADATPHATGAHSNGHGPSFADGDSFAARFAKALKHNAGLGRGKS